MFFVRKENKNVIVLTSEISPLFSQCFGKIVIDLERTNFGVRYKDKKQRMGSIKEVIFRNKKLEWSGQSKNIMNQVGKIIIIFLLQTLLN